MQEPTTFRDRFVIADGSQAYLNGNSLGRLPKRSIALLTGCVEQQWGEVLIGGWNAHWLPVATRIGDKIGSLMGAPLGTTIVCDSTSVNLFKLAWSMLQIAGHRRTIVTDRTNFPSDQYILQGLAQRSGGRFSLKTVDVNGIPFEAIPEKLLEQIDDTTALVSLSHVHYKSGFAFHMENITRAVHDRGARVLWDVSHSVGAMPIHLADSGADGAVGCTYKYLNGGPGAPAFLYVRRNLCQDLQNPIQGWFGANRPFDFSTDYEPSLGIERFVVGTPPILSMAAIEPGVDLVLVAGIEWLRERSIRMSGYFMDECDERLVPLGFSIQTPRDPTCRGSHVSLEHPHAWQITQSLIEQYRVIPDFREPNTIRFGITPLYTTFEELDQAIEGLAASVTRKDYEHYPAERQGVT